MITPMLKIYAGVRQDNRQDMLETLQEIGVVHITPVEPEKVALDEQQHQKLHEAERALQIARSIEPAGEKPAIPAREAAAEIVELQNRSAELIGRLNSLYQQAEKLSVWGDVRLETIQKIHESGLQLEFFTVLEEHVPEVTAECVCVVRHVSAHQVLIGVINRKESAELPDDAELLAYPNRDRPSILEEAAEIDREIKTNNERLVSLAHLREEIAEYVRGFQNEKSLTLANLSGYANEDLFVLEGWIPRTSEAKIVETLKGRSFPVAVQTIPPTEDEQPPTQITYPGWIKPIKGLFDILGTLPGYREYDLSPFFMVALPVFAAMLIGDGGYGLVFMIPALIWYRKLVAKSSEAQVQLLIVIGAVTFIWGMLNGNFFGITPDNVAQLGGYVTVENGTEQVDMEAMKQASGIIPAIGKTMTALAPLWDIDEAKSRDILIKISLIFGSLHLILAHLRQVTGLWPSLRALSEVGWVLFLAGMLGVIWTLFFGEEQLAVPLWLVKAALGVGAFLFIGFTVLDKNPLKRIGVGLAASLLPMIGTFSDTMSYIRLMAVGLASYYIAAAFNSLGAQLASPTPVLWAAAIPVILFGHALNIALCVIAIFAHGVRLNMLEFSNNAGVQWAGYAYEPFSKVEDV